MVCPVCSSPTRVLESRSAEGGGAVRRRRECGGCGRRFTTYERREPVALEVVKRSGEHERFDRAKLLAGLERAAHKRPVREGSLEAIVAGIEAEAERAGGALAAQRIGEMCLAGLREVDRIAYLQFAAVYKQLDVDAVRAELARLGVPPLGEGGGIAAVSGVSGGRGSVRATRESSQSSTDAATRRGTDE